MREDVGLLNPDATDVLAHRSALDGKSDDDLKKEAKEATQGITNALKEMSGEFNWQRATSLSGDTDSDRIVDFKKRLARRTAATNMLQERREFNRQQRANEEAAAAIEAGADIGDTAHTDQPRQGYIGRRGNEESAECVAKKFVNQLEGELGTIKGSNMDQKHLQWTERLRQGITLDIHPGNLILPRGRERHQRRGHKRLPHLAGANRPDHRRRARAVRVDSGHATDSRDVEHVGVQSGDDRSEPQFHLP